MNPEPLSTVREWVERFERLDFRIELERRIEAPLEDVFDVQVVVLNDATPELAAKAVSEGRQLYCRDEEADRIFVRDALLRHADLRPFLDRMRRIWITIASSKRSRIWER